MSKYIYLDVERCIDLLIILVYYILGHKLTELYIRRNQISEFSELHYLMALPNLTVSIQMYCTHVHIYMHH